MFRLKNCLFILVMVLILTPYATAQEGAQRETFDSPELTGWELAPNVTIAEGVMRIPPPDFAFKGGLFSEPGFSVRARFWGEGELVIGYHATDEGMYQIVIGQNYLVLLRDQGRVQRELAAASSVVDVEEWMLINVHVIGTDHQISMNGMMLLSASDLEMLPPGGIFLHARGDATAEIDELVIGEGGLREPPADEPSGAGEDGPAKLPPVDEAVGVWVRTGGPLGGLGYDIRMHPEIPDMMYVTDSWAGVFRSTDGGQTWFPSNNGIDARTGMTGDAIPIFCLTIDPHNPDIIWVGTQHRRGIFKSTDGGENWIRMDNGITEDEGISFRGITVDPQDSNTVYAAAELASFTWSNTEVSGREFDIVKGVVYRTTDGGQNWTAIWYGDNLARYVWVHPQNSNILYISTGIFDREAGNSDPASGLPGGEGVVKSTDGGQTWTRVNNGLNNLYVGSLFMHPINPDILIAGTGNNQYYANAGVYLTTDGGQTWQHTLQDIDIQSVEFALDDPTIAYAGGAAKIFRSEDGGLTWTPTSSGDGWGSPDVRAGFPIDFQIDPHNSNRIFANNYGGGNFLSIDGGQTWVVASTGYTGAQVRDIAVDPANPVRVYAAARSGIFRTDDSGQSWVGLNHEGISFVLEWYVVAVDPANPQHVLAGNNWTGILLQSHNSGESWQTVGDHLGDGRAWRAIAFAPSEPTTIYACTSAFRSGGTLNEDLASLGIYVSHDGGATWQPANDSISQDANVTALAVSPNDPADVYAATGNHGLLRSRNGGQNWEKVNLGLNENPVILAVAVHPEQPRTVYVGLQGAGLFRTDDDGATWSNVATGLPPEGVIADIVFDPVNPAVMYITDRQSGVYRSADSGQTWMSFNDGLRMRDVNALSISGDGHYLYAATEGEGVYRLDLNDSQPD